MYIRIAVEKNHTGLMMLFMEQVREMIRKRMNIIILTIRIERIKLLNIKKKM